MDNSGGDVDCGIVIVTYNSERHIGKLLDSLPAAVGGLSTRCLVVDNASADQTVLAIRDRGDACAVEAGRNLGYAGAINLARARIGSCSALLVLNPDLVLEPGAVTELYRALAQPGTGIAVPRLLSDDGRLYLSTRREPSLSRALGEALFGGRWPARVAQRDSPRPRRLRSPAGCGLGRRRGPADLGGLPGSGR